MSKDLSGQVEASLPRGLSYLEQLQLPDGSFPAIRLAPGRLREVASPFVTAFVLDALRSGGLARDSVMVARSLDFLEQEAEEGLWAFWSRRSLQRGALPPDVDDTACALGVLLGHGRKPAWTAATLERLAAQRTPEGLYRTWLGEREGLDPAEVDLTASLNVLYLLAQLGLRDPMAEATVAARLGEGQLFTSSPYYPDPPVTLYCLARLYAAGGLASPHTLNVARREALALTGEIEPWRLNLGLNAALDLGLERPDGLERLLAEQREDGHWPAGRFFEEAPGVEYHATAFATALGLRAVRLLGSVRNSRPITHRFCSK